METTQSLHQKQAPIQDEQELALAQKAEHLGALAAQIIKMAQPDKREQCKQLVQQLVEDALFAV